MTTLKDYKERVLKSFREEYVREDGLLDIGKYDQDALESFLSLVVDNAVAESFKAVEVEKKECEEDTIVCWDMGCQVAEFNNAIKEVEDRKKQYLNN